MLRLQLMFFLSPPSMINVLVLSLLFWKLGPSCVVLLISLTAAFQTFSFFLFFYIWKAAFLFCCCTKLRRFPGRQLVRARICNKRRNLWSSGQLLEAEWKLWDECECFGQHTIWKVEDFVMPDWIWHLRYLSPHHQHFYLQMAVVQPVWEIWVQIRISSVMFNRVTDPQKTTSKSWKTVEKLWPGCLFVFTSCFGLTFVSSKSHSLKSESLLIFVSFICF